MTRRDYEMLSDALREARPDAEDCTVAERMGWSAAVHAVAAALQERSRAFERWRFLRDAGVTE